MDEPSALAENRPQRADDGEAPQVGHRTSQGEGFENKNKVLDNEAARGPLVEGLPGGRRRDEGAAHGRLFVGTARTALPDPRQNRRTVRLLV